VLEEDDGESEEAGKNELAGAHLDKDQTMIEEQ
jgi:hypothetical protein